MTFLDRIKVYDDCLRITEIPEEIMSRTLRTVRVEHRRKVFERLEGWWNNLIIDMLAKKRKKAIQGKEISDKLYSITDEFKTDNLPIDFNNAFPDKPIDVKNDNRLFVKQLKEIAISDRRIKNAICDYYRAFKQRSMWAREDLLLENEIEDYEDRIISEWERYRDVVFDCDETEISEKEMRDLGKELYKWAEMNTDYIRIRDRVSEPYVTRGSFHILANVRPEPKIHWHPLFLDRIKSVIEMEE